ncbi:MAG: GNAT family N-acetyltransferase [Oceanospirillaceae bacterium]
MEITKADLSHLEAFRVYTQECTNDGLALYASAIGDCESYLKKRIAYAEGKGLPEGWPPISMHFCIESGSILGAIRVRHGTTEYIENVIGHIGYETLPQARGKGIASAMLAWVKNHVISDIAIVTCDANNFSSQKVIEKCGGKYLNTSYSEEDECEILRYQLKRT